MVQSTEKNAEFGQVDLTATSKVFKIAILRGGESITLKALTGNSGNAYIGFNQDLKTTNGFELDSSETLSLTLPITFGVNNFITIYAVTDNAGDDISFIKLIDSFPSSSAGS